jgi:hypothetical protein
MENEKIIKIEKDNEITEEEKKMWEDVRDEKIRYEWSNFRI